MEVDKGSKHRNEESVKAQNYESCTPLPTEFRHGLQGKIRMRETVKCILCKLFANLFHAYGVLQQVMEK